MFDTIGSPALWVGFVAFVLLMLAIDLGLFHRKSHQVSLREALAWSVVWVSLSVAFNGLVYVWFGADRALEFAAGYLIEKALAVDNIFVFVVIFAAFSIPPELQHRVLFWGVIGALVMRAGFIFAGGALLVHFHWLIYVFGAALVATAVKLLVQGESHGDPSQSLAVRVLRRLVPATPDLAGDAFVVRRDGRTYATPLLLALIAVEVSDLVFAVDSIPAIFAVTDDPFIVFTSNIFAILGLRSMYFLLAGILDRFVYLKLGLSFVLLFVGGKMLLLDVVKVPIALSLGVIVAILALSVGASLLRRTPAPEPR